MHPETHLTDDSPVEYQCWILMPLPTYITNLPRVFPLPSDGSVCSKGQKKCDATVSADIW